MMLKTRVLTALVLLAVLLAVAFSGSFLLFAAATAVFFLAAAWESFRLFGVKRPLLPALVWSAGFVLLVIDSKLGGTLLIFGLCTAIWAARLAPALRLGLPPLVGIGNFLLAAIYAIAILGCFLAMAILFRRSPVYLLSVFVIVWIADIGAYFSGKAFGKRKLAPSISPGKSWEGAVGGWLAVLLLMGLAVVFGGSDEIFAARLHAAWGWIGLIGVLTLLVAASVVGDLFESQLKRRAGMKDSSNLLPGHGGVLDRVDALIPVLPMAVLFDFWL